MSLKDFLKIKVILKTIQGLRSFKNGLLWFWTKKIRQGLKFLSLLFWPIKIIVLGLFYLKIKINKIRKSLFFWGNFKIIPRIFLLLFLTFIIWEGKVEAETDFFEQSWLRKAEGKSRAMDFVMAGISEPGNFNKETTSAEIEIENDDQQEFITKPGLDPEENFIPTRLEIEKHIVQEGETISSIARDFGLEIKTILWENKLTTRSIIKPGQVLKILPVDGLTHKVKRGETIKKIAQLYRAEEEKIIAFNELENDQLQVGQLLIIPEGQLPPPPVRVFHRPKDEKVWLEKFVSQPVKGENCRTFYPGQCTYYVAQRICIPWSGHAKSWLANAKAKGYTIGKEPQIGAIISLKETWYGHVGIVEEITGETIIISEMNHLGPWKVNRRELKKNDYRINGYIYP